MARVTKLVCWHYLALILWLPPGTAGAATITIACAAVGIEFELCREGAEAWAVQSDHEVKLVQTPSLANQRLGLYQQLLASGSSDIDVFQIDVIWPGILGRYFIDLKPYVDDARRARHFPGMITNNMVDGELKAIPWYADAGLLYYRKDLLEKYDLPVPQTWAELQDTATTIVIAEHAAGNQRLTGFVFQAKAYEGLTCNALEWIVSFGGEAILAADGTVALTSAEAIAALQTVASWIGTIAPRGMLNYAEEETRGTFQSGSALFMRNWPYAWALVESADSPVKGKVGVGMLPRGPGKGVHASALGGGGLAVSRFSTHPAIAADLVRYLSSEEEQLRRAVKGASNPTIISLYRNPDLLEARPFIAELYPILTSAVARPARTVGSSYNRLSTVFWNAVHDTLAGEGDAAANLALTQRRLEQLRRTAKW